MTKANFRTVDEVMCAGSRIGRICTGNKIAYQRIPKIRDLYGLGLGQVPLHLRPEDAVMDGGGNVAEVPNRGGLGPYGAAVSVGQITRTGGLLTLNSSYLRAANPLDLIGVHAFMVVSTSVSGSNYGVLGRSASATAGERTHFQWQSGSRRFLMDRYDGATYVSSGYLFASLTPQLALIELYTTRATAQMWVNGVAVEAANHSFPDFHIDRIGSGRTASSFAGQLGDVVSLISDGSPAMAVPIKTIRARLAARHGLTVAA